MNKPIDGKETGYNRRDVLKHTALATGGVIVGATAISGVATARQTGGKALAFGDDFEEFVGVRRREPFKVVEVRSEPLFVASCKSGNSAPKGWVDYLIEYCDDGAESIMATRNHKQVQEGEKYEFTSARPTDCPAFPGAVKTGFKPVR